ncbi:MAG: hypothetical protein Q7T45_09135 [Bradyrhizobium sp.]|uniref:hypothetical protein n=1 Tax=Bradyrhizobium sp. TaxID=376 RepID=UPI00271FEFE8|nr:hypothetical protein [Bradyrhizobium sp.]MDO8397973.1 hypothetical protein [Bradyrhizobium sp.]
MINFAPDNPIARLLEAPPLQQMAFQALSRGRNLNQSEIDRFREHGVVAIDLFRPWSTQVDWVLFNGEYFEFADEGDDRGEQVLTMGVISDNGLIDAVAWHPATRRLAVWLGVGFALGEYKIRDHMENSSTGLPVFRSPLGWLRAGCEGIVIVRKTFAHIVLKKVPLLLAEDESHRIELVGMFPVGGARPRILVRCSADPGPAHKLEAVA